MIGLLKYYIKKRAYVIGIISFIVILLAITLFRDGYIRSYIDYMDKLVEHPMNCPIVYYTVISLV